MANGTDQTNPAPVTPPAAPPPGPTPDVNPAGGASSSWGPGEIVLDPNQDKMTRTFDALHQGGVAVTDGVSNNGWVHYSKVDQFLHDNPNYEKGTFFTGPDGNLAGVVKASQAGAFQKNNPTYKPGVPQNAGWDPNASRLASWGNFVDAQRKAVEEGANMWGGLGIVPKLAKSLTFDTAQAAAQEASKYIGAEAESPTAPSWYRNYVAPAAEASGQFLEGSYDPKQFALMAALGKVPGGPLANTALRGLQGYFTYQQLHGAYQQGNAAQDAFQRGDTAEGVRQLTSALYSGGMAYDIANQTAQEVARNPQGALDDLRRSVPTIKGTAVGDFAVDLLRQSAEKQLQRVLTQGGGTKKEKAIAERVAPQMAERGVLAATRQGLEEKSAEQADIAGQKLDDFYQSLPQNTRIPTQPLLNHFDEAKQEFIAPDSGAVLDQNGIDKVDALKQVVQQFGSDVSVNDIVALRRLWDQQVAASGPGHLLPADETTAIAIKKEAANAIRGELAKQFPDLAQLNKEFSFWKGVNTVMSATNLRKGGHAWFSLQDLLFGTGGAGLLAHLGLAAGGAGVGAAVGLSKAMKSTAWNTVSAKAKYQIANFLADGNVREAARVAAKETGGAEPGPGTRPNVVPPWTGTGQGGAAAPAAPAAQPPEAGATTPIVPSWTNTGQGNLPFGETAPAAAAAPAEEPGAAAQPVAPTFAGVGQPRPAEAQPTATPERLAQQSAAVSQAKLDARGGVRGRSLEQLDADHRATQQAAYLPELEPEHLRAEAPGQLGKETSQVYQDANGNWTPERQALHEWIIKKMLGSGKGATGKPTVDYVVGGAGSGKSTAVIRELRAANPDAAVINSDDAMQALPEFKLFQKSDPLGGAERLHAEASAIAKEATRRARENNQSMILDKVGRSAEKGAADIRDMKGAGYDVGLHGVDRDTDAALAGMVQRFEGREPRWVPPANVVEGHNGAANAFQQNAQLPEVDRWTLHMANEGGTPTHELVAENGKIYNKERWQEHRAKGDLDDSGGTENNRGLGLYPGGAGGNAPGPGRVRTQEPQPSGNAGRPEVPGGAPGRVPQEALNVTDSAPSRDKPVILTYGGAFNPVHTGHVEALQAAHDALTQAGYDVQGSVVAPTADKLLANKPLKPGETRLPIDARARVADAAFPSEINGTPVEVSTKPAEDVERNPGKPRRSDLARSVQAQYPNHTIVNVTGEDAPVPGAPEQHPSLYSGAPGSNHEGINYLTLPRGEEGISSSKVRAALAGGEQTLPGMSPEAERVYREEVAKQAPAEPTLPGMEHVPAARAQAAAEQQGRQLSEQAAAPAGSIEGAAGEMERLSPLFRSAEVSGQSEMFQPQAEAQPERGMPPPGEVGRVPVSDLKVDPHRFQYKAGTDVEGVSPLLKETKVWNPDLAGVISVWRDPADGQNYVVNGHHRFELAKRLGVPDMVVRHIVADTAEEARTIGAMQNIAEGRGTAIDAAKFFRQTDRGPQELQQKGISLSEGKVHDGLALAALDPDIFQRVVNGDLKQGRAVTIGESGLDHAQQRSLMDTVDKRERGGKNVSQGQLAEFIRLQRGAGQTTESQTDLFGTHQVARSLGFEKAEVSDYVKQQIAREKRTFSFVSTGGRPEQLARAGAGNIDVERSGEMSTQAAQAEEVYNKLSTRGGPISDILDEASRRLAGGENAGTVKAEAYAKIRQAISETLGRKLEPGAGRPEGAP